jgi:hypothetical protein
VNNDFGQSKTSQITIEQNIMLIVSFSVAAVIAVAGSIFLLWMGFKVLGIFRIQYNRFLAE